MLGYDLNVIERGVRGLFAREFLTRQRKVRYTAFCSVVDSDKQTEKYNTISTIPQMSEIKDERVLAGFSEYSYELQNKIYGVGVKLPRTLFEFDQTGQVRTLIQSMGSRVANFPDKLVFSVIANGESGTGYDGKAFFATDHDLGDGTSQSNLLAGSITNTEVTTGASITATVWQTILAKFAFELAYAKAVMLGFKDDRGEPWHEELDPEGLMIVCHPRFEHVVRTVLEGNKLIATSNIAVGGVKSVITTPYTDIFKHGGTLCYGTWYLLKIDTPVRPFLFQRFGPKTNFPDAIPESDQQILQALRSVEVQTVMRGGADIDAHTFFDDEYLVGARCIYSAGYGMWQNAIKVYGSNA